MSNTKVLVFVKSQQSLLYLDPEIAAKYQTKIQLEEIKNQRIITRKSDTVRRTGIRGHPSLGQSDQVVWAYELVANEFEQRFPTMSLKPIK